MENKIREIAKNNGYHVRSSKALEEMIELSDAIHHFNQYDLNDIIEEIADVEIVISQLKVILDIQEEVELCEKYKIDRQLLRIKKAKAQLEVAEVGEEEWTRQLKL